MKLYAEKEKVVEIRSSLADFAGDTQAWKLAFYELWRYELTYSFAYRLRVWEYSNKTVDVQILARPGYKDAIISTMKSLGYRNIKVENCAVASISPYDGDMEDQDDIEAAVIEY